MDQRGATSFKELIVWQKAHKFVLEIYSFTESFPAKETYGLMSQMRQVGRFSGSEYCRGI